jgi:hypothetical protein
MPDGILHLHVPHNKTDLGKILQLCLRHYNAKLPTRIVIDPDIGEQDER